MNEVRATDVAVVGAGFAGMYMVHRVRQAGLSVQCFEGGTDVGGTWYWNRYPGCRCDVESMEYSYDFDDALQQVQPPAVDHVRDASFQRRTRRSGGPLDPRNRRRRQRLRRVCVPQRQRPSSRGPGG